MGISTRTGKMCDWCIQQLKRMDPMTSTTTLQSAWVFYVGCCVISCVLRDDMPWVKLYASHGLTNCIYVIYTFEFHYIMRGEKIQLVEYQNKCIKDMLHTKYMQDVHAMVYLACFPSPKVTSFHWVWHDLNDTEDYHFIHFNFLQSVVTTW
jgi:hypothetical protein